MCLDSVYVVFEKSNAQHFFKPIIHKYINHCYLIVPQGRYFIAYNKSVDDIEIYTIDKISDILQNKIVIKVKPKKAKKGILMINSCVGSVKQYLGITNPFIFTPYQLFRSLK